MYSMRLINSSIPENMLFSSPSDLLSSESATIPVSRLDRSTRAVFVSSRVVCSPSALSGLTIAVRSVMAVERLHRALLDSLSV